MADKPRKPVERLADAEREIALLEAQQRNLDEENRLLKARLAALERSARPPQPPVHRPVYGRDPAAALPEPPPDMPRQVSSPVFLMGHGGGGSGRLPQPYDDDPLHDPRVVPALARHGMQHPETQRVLREVVNEYANDPSRQARAREALRLRESLERSEAARRRGLVENAIPLGLSPDPRTHPGSQQRTTGEIPWEEFPEHDPAFIRQLGVRKVSVTLDRAGPWPASVPQPQPAIAGPRNVPVTGSEFPSLPAQAGDHDDESVWVGIAGAATQPAGESPA